MRRIIVALLVLLLFAVEISAEANTARGDLNERFKDRILEYNGLRYEERSRITTVLLMGIDQRQDRVQETAYRSGGQADFLVLLVFDDNEKTVQPVQINRDTMTKITVLNVMGQVSGSRVAQVCLAHGFGDGGEQSCELAADAVSGLLNGVEIDHYYAMNLDGIAAFNDVLGGVQVTLEEDFTAYDSEMTAGSTLTLHGEQAEYFLRQRFFVGDQSNVSRQRRQQAYLSAAGEVLQERLAESASFVNVFFNSLDGYSTTNMNRGRIVNLANKAREYEILPGAALVGESVVGENGFMEFHADPDARMQLVLNTFYVQDA